MTTETQRIADGSTLVRLVRAIETQLRAWVAASWLASTSKTITNAFEVATDTSGVAGSFRAIARWTRHSFLYQWLTTEPDPDVVVIDLRETYTVGPVIALLDRVQPTVESAWRTSSTRGLTTKFTKKRPCFENSRTLQLLVAALEPPKSPDEKQKK